jgi:thiamine biosynthesis lipoprotein
MLRRKFLAASFGTMASAMAPASIQRNGQLFTGAALAFGTTVSVSVVHDDERQAVAAIRDALGQATRIDRLMSIYNPASQVFQLNRDGVLEHPHPHLLLVLRQAHTLSELTRGAFDITVQPLWQAYRAAADQSALPAPQQRRLAKLRVGWRRLAFSAERVSLGKPGAAITLNGLAQGYAADLAMAAVHARGIEHALLDTGEFSAHGNNGAQHPWTLGVLHPRDADALAAVIRPGARCVATSGDYASTFTPDFAHHHIFDPATGDSPTELASVTVLAPTALLADGLSTAFMVMGSRKAHALAKTLSAVDLMTINKRGVVWRSPAFPTAA